MDNKMKIKEIKYERRLTNDENVSMRSVNENGKQYIEGYSFYWDTPSLPIYERGVVFKEIVKRGALDNVLKNNPDVFATINHDQSKGLARTKNGTLELRSDDKGLFYRFSVPDTQLGRDTLTMVKDQYYTQASYVFTLDEGDSKLEKRSGEEYPYHVIENFKNLYDISLVDNAANGANTAVQVSERLYKRAMDISDDSSSGSTGSTVVVEVDVAVVPETDDDNQDQPVAVPVADDVEGLELTIIKLKLC